MKFRIILLSFLAAQLFLLAHPVFADTGPKPQMEFVFQQAATGKPVTILSGILYECDQPDCRDAAPLQELGPQRFTCDSLNCSALAYGFRDYHRLEIQFSDGKTRQSNIFKTVGFDSNYVVTIQPEDLLVEPQFSLFILPPTITILIACVCVLVIGVAIMVLIIFLVRRSSQK